MGAGIRWTEDQLAAFNRKRDSYGVAMNHPSRKCERCAREFRPVRTDHVYCSHSCGTAANIRRIAPLPIAKPCVICAATFSANDDGEKYCGEACAKEAERRRQRTGEGTGSKNHLRKLKRPTLVCDRCGTQYTVPPSHAKRSAKLKFCGQECRTAYMGTHPSAFPQTRTRRGSGGVRADLGRYFRSSWEANYARYLNWLKANAQISAWEYESSTFVFYGITRGSRFYTPDFKVIALDASYEWHEIKGYMDQRSATKLKRFRRRYPQEKLVLIDKRVYNAIAVTMKPLIADWEGRVRRC